MLESLEIAMFYILLMSIILCTLSYFIWLGGVKKELIGQLATYLVIVAIIASSIAIILRMVISGNPPLTNGYEFLLTFVWGILVVYLYAEYRYKIRALGAFVMPIAFLLLMFIIMTMGPEERVAQTIPPALKSQWLTFHVVTAIFSYGAFALSFGLGIMYLMKLSNEGTHKMSNSRGIVSRFPALDKLDELEYKVIAFAFPLLTLCIITGAIWANYAWGTYWSWDPKETWSLITWIIYAAYLHARLMYGWKGKRAAWLAIFGFAAVLFTFFGVNYFLSGLHSYAS
ncbi:c-type cytochrome biogenesis protein CcsB [Desulfosporosinus sp. BICA1-9]|uniref:c-type cytochrome biogenesis protein CcsB n=1 Tax=Desulfosporosinus sp. BICA1-9 TaxID=1531958 RepID=UPI00054C07A8|nr:c-type cytochrome biogenesis protein CcsB [Desulfosporosinus sp. BICA1-9]KJS46058.1 MAG: cytochrome C biogenesis protein ResC [Peptococcaceae bacterium BRH_c23]KJS90632.1 MAG: cytochrome C biogenesis protein ResC [Desulfosporosinus sp. BICA1-9]